MLEKGGHLKRSGRISRGIGPTETRASSGIPILGRVAAGQPILAEENQEGTLDTAEMFGDPRGMFALKVRGDSMIDAGILAGDYVVVRSQENASAGEIVVALVGDEATVKYYRPREDSVELVPANAKYEPIVVAEESDFRILGTVRGVIRTIGR
jgi:repressor LexA